MLSVDFGFPVAVAVVVAVAAFFRRAGGQVGGEASYFLP